MKGLRRILFWVGLAAGILILVALALAPRSVPADLADVTRGPLVVTLDEEGETRVRERYVISAPLAGRVLRIELEPGDPVVAGQSVLATFEPADPSLLDARSLSSSQARVRAAEAALERARAELERARAERDFAFTELERSRRLARDGILSTELLDSAELTANTSEKTLRAAEFAVRNRQSELEVAEAALLVVTDPGANRGAGTITIRSPIDGVVLRRLLESSTVVPVGEPLLEVGDPTRLEIVSDYLSTDAVRIRPGQRVLIDRWGGDTTLSGRVRRVEPYGFTKVSALGVEEQRVNVVIDFDDAPESLAGLGDGFHVEVRVVIWEADDVARVPTSALSRDGDAWVVFAVDGGRAVLRRTEIGRRNALEAEVLSGLTEGEAVVVHPSDAIAAGTRIARRSAGD